MALKEIAIFTGYGQAGKSRIATEIGAQLNRKVISLEPLGELGFRNPDFIQDELDHRLKMTVAIAGLAKHARGDHRLIFDGVSDLRTFTALTDMAPTRLIAVNAAKAVREQRRVSNTSKRVDEESTIWRLEAADAAADRVGQEELLRMANLRLTNDEDDPRSLEPIVKSARRFLERSMHAAYGDHDPYYEGNEWRRGFGVKVDIPDHIMQMQPPLVSPTS